MPRRIISLVPTTGVAVLAVAGLLAVVPTTSVGLQMGIGDNNPKMFGNPYYRLLHTSPRSMHGSRQRKPSTWSR